MKTRGGDRLSTIGLSKLPGFFEVVAGVLYFIGFWPAIAAIISWVFWAHDSIRAGTTWWPAPLHEFLFGTIGSDMGKMENGITLAQKAEDVCVWATISVAFLVPGTIALYAYYRVRPYADFESFALSLCGQRVDVRVHSQYASVRLLDEYRDRRVGKQEFLPGMPPSNLTEVARELAFKGLDAFPKSTSFHVNIKDSKGEYFVIVNRSVGPVASRC